MSAATSARTQVRSPATATAARASAAHEAHPVRQPVRQQVQGFAFMSGKEDEFKLHLNDIPRQQESLDVEGFKPSLLSRLMDLVSPLK
jgi:hypothetical protein